MGIDRIVEDYLRRLDTAATVLPAGRRTELIADIRGHIDAALQEQGGGELDVRNVLERLGPPEDIVAAAVDRDHGVPTTPAPGAIETIAVSVLAVGGFALPIMGWIPGLVLVLVSQVWSTREKQIGLLAPFAILYLPFLVMALLGGSTARSGLADAMLLPLVYGRLPWLAGAIYLAVRLRARRI